MGRLETIYTVFISLLIILAYHKCVVYDQVQVEELDTENKNIESTTTMDTSKLAICNNSLIISRLNNNRTFDRMRVEKSVPEFSESSNLFIHSIDSTHQLLYKNSSVWAPLSCKSEQSIAIIVCYRDRGDQLKYLLFYLFPLLKRQFHTFSIFIINQVDAGLFNRAKLFNIGFDLAKSEHDFDCYTFHDVDLLLENEQITYQCDLNNPRHMSTSINKFHYKILQNTKMFGGVSQLTGKQFESLNGYSNNFWGWGGEDDQMYARLKVAGMKLQRPNPQNSSRWTMIPHNHEASNSANPKRKDLVKKSGPRQWKVDGLSSLEYDVKGREVVAEGLFTRYDVDIHAPFKFSEAYPDLIEGPKF